MQVNEALSFLAALLTSVRWAHLRNLRDPTEALNTKVFDETLGISLNFQIQFLMYVEHLGNILGQHQPHTREV